MNRYILFVLCFIGFSLVSHTAVAKTLHAILVADTIHDITAVTRPDIHKWQSEVRLIAKHTQMDLKEKVFCGENFHKDKVSAYLLNLSIQPDDTVVFYFSGHGFRTFQKKTPWPFMNFDLSSQGLDVQWIADTIRGKKPQFALIMTDCCNCYAERGMFGDHTKDITVKMKHLAPNYAGYRQLFCNAKGCVVISSCSAGQFSYGSHIGGLYTQCFFNSLNHELSQPTPNWKNLIQRAYGYINHIQRPVSQVYR
jgi:Caspase domain